jgi:multiple sugar transport system substrate-binding protein
LLERRRLLKAGAAAALGSVVPLGRAAGAASRSLRILVPAHKARFVEQYAAQWSERNASVVVVDVVAYARSAVHDVILFPEPPALFQRELAPLDDVHAELERRFGPPLDLARKSTFNPGTGHFFALPISFTPALAACRREVSLDLASESAVRALLYRFGAYEHDEQGAPALKTRHTLEALRYSGAHLHEPIPQGAQRRIAPVRAIECAGIRRASDNIDRAKRFLVDYTRASADAFARRPGVDVPCFLGSVAQFEQRLASFAPELAVALDDVLNWSTNIGFPGHATPAAMDVLGQSVLTRMFRRSATGLLTPETALAEADARCVAIWNQWRYQRLV